METPAIKQYKKFETQCPDSVILMQMGDFFEAFGNSAKILNLVCGLTLTTTRCNVQMAGSPYHSIETYIIKLVQAGHKVVVVKDTNKKPDGTIKRDIVRIITPGITADNKLLE